MATEAILSAIVFVVNPLLAGDKAKDVKRLAAAASSLLAVIAVFLGQVSTGSVEVTGIQAVQDAVVQAAVVWGGSELINNGLSLAKAAWAKMKGK